MMVMMKMMMIGVVLSCAAAVAAPATAATAVEDGFVVLMTQSREDFGALDRVVPIGKENAMALHATVFDDDKNEKEDVAEKRRRSELVSFSMALKHKEGGVEWLQKEYAQRTDPNHAKWRQWLTAERIREMVDAPLEREQAVRQYLMSHGVPEASIERVSSSLRVKAHFKVVERIFGDIEMVLVYNSISGRRDKTFIGKLSLPARVAQHVELVMGLVPRTHMRNAPHTGYGANAIANSRVSLAQHELVRTASKLLAGVDIGATPERLGLGLAQLDPNPPALPKMQMQAKVPNTDRTCGTGPSAGYAQACYTASSTVYGCCPEQSTCCPAVTTGPTCCTNGTVCCNGECKAYCGRDDSDVFVTPDVLRDQYNVPKGFAMSATKLSTPYAQAVVSFGDQYAEGPRNFFNAGFRERDVPIKQVNAKSCLDDGCDQVESDLDVQYMAAMGSGVPMWFWANEGTVYTLEWAESVLNSTEPFTPDVYSISYIDDENTYIMQNREQYLTRSNQELMKLGALGKTVIACSGDTGAPAWTNNFPIPTTGRNFPFGCADCPTDQNLCTQVRVVFTDPDTQKVYRCALPGGLQSRSPVYLEACKVALNHTSCQEALQAYPQKTAQMCGTSVHTNNATGMPHIFSHNCTCAQLPNLTDSTGACMIEGWVYDEDDGVSFTPLYPASSPYVTAVGATRLSENNAGFCNQAASDAVGFGVSREVECPRRDVVSSIATHSRITSGGGFSQLFPASAAPWQAEAVSQYVKAHQASGEMPPANTYNASNRAYPDVSFAGHHYLVGMNPLGTDIMSCPCMLHSVDGTSCSSPAFAGIVGLINTRLLAQGEPVLGPINPLLYKMAAEFPEAFTDVVDGDNKCMEKLCSEWGYVAARGWDPVSGLGVPNVERILEYLKANPVNATKHS
eukprot:TRINITY_DN65830_c8_g4_i1.p1 TRINITY_DN65830_c8_g4~~TRINITY_DN65830_c8_g4_i1.p1  ORF type:complete len:907 (+),score=484.91 TRINITY_DN65830_c8_g4_i1:122-2842(+)